MTSDGKPYAPIKMKQLIKECYYISSSIHTSYNELLDISPSEKDYLIQCIKETNEKKKEGLEKAQEAAKNKKK